MKLLMIYPNKAMTIRAPLGLGYLSAYLKNSGHEMRLFDTTFIKCDITLGDDFLRENSLQIKNPDFNEFNIFQKNVNVFDLLKTEIEEFKPDIIGMSLVDPNYDFGLKILKYCKSMWLNIPIIVGGPLTTFVPEDIIKEECIDAIGRGECEEALVEFMNRYEKGGWNNVYDVYNFWVKDKDYYTNLIIYKNNIKLFDSVYGLSPDLDIYDDRHFIRPLGGKTYRMATVIWSRGCIFSCNYCANSSFYKSANIKAKQYYRIKDVKFFIQELKIIKEKYNLNFLMFVDDIWPMHKIELIKEFCNLYKKEVNIPFSINLHCKIVNEESFSMAVDVGLRNVCIGVESGNKRIREQILNRRYSDDDLKFVFGLAHKYKIRCSSFNIIGLPFENRQNILETIELNKKLNPHSATVTFFHPYRGSVLRQMCIDEKYIDDENFYEDVYRVESRLNMPQITKKELTGLMNSFQLYLKLPEKYYSLIEKQENEELIESKNIRNNILMPIFNEIQSKEPKWDFNKKTEWWL